MMDYFAALSFLSLSLFGALLRFKLGSMKDSIFGSFLNSSRVILDRYFYKDFKWRVVVV